MLFLVFAVLGAVLVVGLLGLMFFVRSAEQGPITEAVPNEPEIETKPIVSDVDVVDRADDAESDFVEGDGRPVRATASEIEAAPTCAGRSDGRLRIGGLLPLSGGISALGPAMEAGAELAVNDINALGGVLGTSVEWIVVDSTNNSAEASLAVDELLAADVDVIVGAATSTLSKNVIDAIAAQCVVQISPSNTSSFFTSSDPAQLYFRTAPSDVLQGQALAEVISADGPSSVFLIGLNVAYGQELVESTSAALESRGVTVLGSSFYTADQTDYGAEIDAAVAAGPEALVLAGFGETSGLLTELIGAGSGPGPVSIYLVDGNLRDYDIEIPVPGALLGVQGTRPGAEVDTEFRERLLALNPDIDAFTYGPETYDAVMIAALAAAVANSDSASEIAKRINGVTAGGQPCSSYDDCLFQIQRDVDIDYDGPSGPLSFSQAGEPAEASYRLMTYEADNRLAETVVRHVDVTVSD